MIRYDMKNEQVPPELCDRYRDGQQDSNGNNKENVKLKRSIRRVS